MEKGRLRTLSSVVSTSQLETSSEDTQPKRLRWVYCTCYSISRRGLTRVAYLDEGAMRRPRRRDKREVVTPTSLCIILKLKAKTWEINRMRLV